RTYWGGALFCLLADLEVRERTQNQKSLDDALRAILDRGGNLAARWDIIQVMAEADRATGVSAISDLYRKMGGEPYDVDLAKLWKSLGVRPSGTKVAFDDSAPLAKVRRAITARYP